ncbi:hypothetical protein EBN88_25600 [Streptomyces triticirhizae]|uniref:Pyrroloquinoline-quinone binding quinoprotein n=1 Tax=Streptomyces triticirhizae TaxID=2483353 RepID=A0A3M2L2K4_9ACTN|nr:hypothetical protein EBN88_25600 [Streptomyces triticirhizae]
MAGLAVGLLAACGGGTDDQVDGSLTEASDEEKDGGSAASGGPSDDEGDAELGPPETQLPVPAVYDTSRGWQTESGEALALPHARAVAEPVWGANTAEARLRVRDLATGETRWTSEPVTAVSPDSALAFLALSYEGRDYAVAWSAGVTEGDAIERGDEVTVLHIFPVDESTDAPEPTYVEVEGEGRVEERGGLAVTFGGDLDFLPGAESVVAVDPATGDRLSLLPEVLEPPASCADCGPVSDASEAVILGTTPSGPLLGEPGLYDDFDAVWVSGGWSLADIAPDDADPTDSTGSLVADGAIVAVWPSLEDENQRVWAAVDSATGEIRARLQCPVGHTAVGASEGLSSNGRYLFHERVVFDLQEGTGDCFPETEDTNPVRFTAITDTGRAFGTAELPDDPFGDVPLQLDLATGEVTEFLDEEPPPIFPTTDIDGYGIFTDDPDYVTVTVIYPPSEGGDA